MPLEVTKIILHDFSWKILQRLLLGIEDFAEIII